ncbi:MAG: Ig-like domain-containing protein, partial [Arcobacteraceae bacterium]|nr:Ig-like domain-containing protein [Arcobacteraceae bacterium]
MSDGNVVKVDITTLAPPDTTPPTITSVTVPSNSTYKATQTLSFTVNTSENVTVVTTGGTPSIALTIGGTTKYATYVSGSGTQALLFSYTVESGLLDTDGITVGALGLNSGTMKDAAGNDMTLTLNSVGATTSVLVDSTNPTTTTFSPTLSATNVPLSSDLVLTFDENIAKGTGNVVIKKYSDDSVLQTIDVTSGAVVVSGTTATISHSTPFALNTEYYVTVDATAFDDTTGNSFAGISSKDTLKFTSVNNMTPTIGGITTTTTIDDNATTTPFSSVTIADNESDNVSVTVALDTQAKGIFTLASLTASGFTDNSNGSYSLATTTPALAQAAIRQLVFNPSDNRVAPASTEVTTFTITVNDGTSSGTSSTTTVTSTSVNDAPIIISTAITTATQDIVYSYSLLATDVDVNDTLTWSVKNGTTLPSWLTLSRGSGTQTSFAGIGIAPTTNGGTYDDADGTDGVNAKISFGTIKFADNKLFFIDKEEYGIRYVDANGKIQTFYGGDGVTNTTLYGIAYDATQNLIYTVDYVNAKIYMIDSFGTKTLISNVGANPNSLVLNSNKDKLYVAAKMAIYEIDLTNTNPDTNRRVIIGDGIAVGTSLVGSGIASTSKVNTPRDPILDGNGNLLFLDSGNLVVRQINLMADTVTTIAGQDAQRAISGDGGVAVNATLDSPYSLTRDSNGNLYIGEKSYSNNKIRIVKTNGIIDNYADVSGTGFMDTMTISDTDNIYVGFTAGYKIDTFLPSSTILSGTSTNADVGLYDLNLTVTDGTVTVPHNFQITVANVNDAPTSQDINITINEDANKTFSINDFNFTDVDFNSSLHSVYIT